MRRWEDLFDRDQIESLPAAVIIKWVFVATSVISIPWFLLKGLAALIGFHTISWNGQYLTGFTGLTVGTIQGLLVAAFLAACISTALLVARWLLPKLDVPDDEDTGNNPPSG